MVRRILIILVIFMAVICHATEDLDSKLVTLETNYGTIVLEVYPETAPNLTKRFLHLCKEGFYEGTYFHYVDPDFIIAGGDLYTKPGDLNTEKIEALDYLDDEICASALGLDTLLVEDSHLANHLPSHSPARNMTMKQLLMEQGYTFTDNLPSLPADYGHLAMVSNEPDANRSQFFIITSAEGTPWLNGKNTVIGKVKKGMDTVHKIENIPHNHNNIPLEDYRAVILEIKID